MKSLFSPTGLVKDALEGSSSQTKAIPGGLWLTLMLRDVQHAPMEQGLKL